jgi:uncharacterized membrane protein YfcA
LFYLILFAIAVLSGVTAAVSGFGIGSMLTPLLIARYGTGTAVAAVAIPHAIATAVRCWRLRASIDWSVIRRFGLLSAAGGLIGALLFTRLANDMLTLILGVLLVATAVAGLTGWNARWTPRGILVSVMGLLSGFFGGIAGNQGGLRAAALMAFSLSATTFVATSSAAGLLVDFARTPIYVWRAGPDLLALSRPIALASVGVLVGTVGGERLLLGLSPDRFRRLVSSLIGLLGIWLLTRVI